MADTVEKVRRAVMQAPATESRFLARLFPGITIRDHTPRETIFYANVSRGLVADFFNTIDAKLMFAKVNF
jgi:hypothetical protein